MSYRARYVRSFIPGTSPSTSVVGSDTSNRYSEVIQLSQSLVVSAVINETTLTIQSQDLSLFLPNTLVLIEGSSNGDNDGLFEIDKASVDGVAVQITFKNTSFKSVAEEGKIYIPQEVTIQHNLDSQDILYRLKNLVTGGTTNVKEDSTDNNKLILIPETPIRGDFRISILT